MAAGWCRRSFLGAVNGNRRRDRPQPKSRPDVTQKGVRRLERGALAALHQALLQVIAVLR